LAARSASRSAISSNARLPEYAQHCPEPEIAVQVDFFFKRDGLPGVCVFVDGPVHDAPAQAEHDRRVRAALRDGGYRVIELKTTDDLRPQLDRHGDVFQQS
jgi:hypothetical protein